MNQDKNKNLFLIFLLLFFALCFLLYFSHRVITPFLIAFALAYLMDPLVDKAESKGVPRTGAVIFIMAVLFLLVVFFCILFIPILSMQTESLMQNIPAYIGIVKDWLQPLLDVIRGLDPEKVEAILNKGLSKFGELPMKALQFSGKLLLGSISNLFNIVLMIANLVIIPVVMFYLLRDFDSINKRLLNLAPLRLQEKIGNLVLEIDQVLSNFVRGQLMVVTIMGLMYACGLFLCDTPMSLSLGLMAGLVNLVPYLGLILGFVPAAILTFMHTQEWLSVLGVAGVFAFVQAIESMVITPRILGENIGLHPVAVIFAVLLGGELFGLVGMILGVPAVAILNVLFSHGVFQYKNSPFYSDN